MASTAPRTDDSETFIRAFARGLGVIEAMGHGKQQQSLADVAAATALPRSVVRRILLTLVELRYAASDGKRYWLTPRVLNLGFSYLYTLPFWREGQLALEDLRTEVGESCSMAVLDGDDLVYVARVPSRRILSMNLSVGSRLPAHAVSLGRALLGGLEAGALDAYLARAELRRFTPRTQTSRTKLRRAIAQVQRDGYAWVDSELDEAICGIAVPVRDREGGVVAALNVSLISGEWSEAKAKSRFLAPLRRAAVQMRSAMLG